MNLTQVKAVGPTIAEVRTADFWTSVTVAKLEEVRGQAAGRHAVPASARLPLAAAQGHRHQGRPGLVERKTARRQARRACNSPPTASGSRRCCETCSTTNETLQRIKAGKPVSRGRPAGADLARADPRPDARPATTWSTTTPRRAGHLDLAIRGIIGLDAEAVHERFTELRPAAPDLNSTQIRFLDLLQNHIAKYGSIEVDRLYEPPFTTLHTDSLDGVFPDEDQVDEHARHHRIASSRQNGRDRRSA